MFFSTCPWDRKISQLKKYNIIKLIIFFSYPDESFSLGVEDFFGVLKDSVEKVKGNKIKAIMGIIKNMIMRSKKTIP